MAATKDPFSIAFDGLWATLEASPLFCAAFQTGNRIKYNLTVRAPDKPDATSADFPECKIIPVRGATKLMISSSSTFIDKQYRIEVALGDLRTDDYMHPLEFIIIAAVSRWQTTLLPLQWKGKPFIKLVTVEPAQEGRSNEKLTRGIASWTVVLSLTIQLYFATADLQNLALGDLTGEWQNAVLNQG